MSRLDASKRARLPQSAFAYIDSRGRRRLPIHAEAHVRNALARFNQVHCSPASPGRAPVGALAPAALADPLPREDLERQLRRRWPVTVTARQRLASREMMGRVTLSRLLRNAFPHLTPGLVCALIAAGSIAGAGWAQERAVPPPALRKPDVRYEPSQTEVVQVMLRLGDVRTSDVVYDLGCGDGRIVIAAAIQAGARGVCVDIDPQRIAESRENARQAGVTERIEFLNQDLLTTDISRATVVMLFLSPELNLRVRAKLWRELKPGTRVVSHWHDMGDWKPQQVVLVTSDGRERPVYVWTIPGK